MNLAQVSSKTKGPVISDQLLFKLSYKRFCKHYNQHNAQFPIGPFPRSHPYTLKDGDMKTGLSALKQWTKQVTTDMASGKKCITNVLRTNNLKLRQSSDGRYRAKSGTAGHLAKLTYAGLFLGEQETADRPHEQKVYRHRDLGGKGFGWRPYKRFRGTIHDYELLLNPNLLPLELIPPDITFLAVTTDFSTLNKNFRNESDEIISAIQHQNIDNISISKSQILAHSLVTDINTKNKYISEKEEHHVQTASEEKKDLEEGSPPKAGNGGEGGRAAKLLIEEMNMAGKGNTGADLGLQEAFIHHSEGDKKAYYAHSLMEYYTKRLAQAMGNKYVNSQMEKGYQNALKLLNSTSEENLDAFFERMSHTILHIEKGMKSNPLAYVVGPARFFDPEEKYGILHYEKNWLQTYEHRGKEFKDIEEIRTRKQQAQMMSEAELADKDKRFYYLAFRFRQNLIEIHKDDPRLHKANLINWERDLRMMVSKESIPIAELLSVMEWLLKSPKLNAGWWRNKYHINGIKSPGSLRRNYAQIKKGYLSDEEYDSKTAQAIPSKIQQPKQIPLKQAGPKQIPRKAIPPKRIPR